MSAGTVYLIHFSRPIGDLANPRGQAQHYLGYADDLAGRLARHEAGNGSAIMRAVKAAGVSWSVVRTWTGDRNMKSQLKRRHKSRVYCPVCNPQEAENG